jgi:CheY-like chemotaxis protein
MNLAANAADAMPEGGRLTIRTRNRILDEEHCQTKPECSPGRYAQITVSDTGQGMDAAALRQIFDPFFTTKEVGKGTGLGLSMVFGIVKGHGGHIVCHSQPGAGATFDIFFKAVRERPVLEAEPPAPDHVRGGGETLLIVDDDSSIRTVCGQILSGWGYRPIPAASGEEAIEIYRDKGDQISLVLLDLGMPGMGGWQCLSELRNINPRVKIIVVSGYAEGRDIKDTPGLAADAFVAKPYRGARLLETVRAVLDGREDA